MNEQTQPTPMRKSLGIFAGMLIGVSFGLFFALLLEEKAQWISGKHAGVMAIAVASQIIGLILGVIWKPKIKVKKEIQQDL